ncbi:MAG: hypothetical protein AAGD38_05650 [Acidobacteriota bacterium]
MTLRVDAEQRLVVSPVRTAPDPRLAIALARALVIIEQHSLPTGEIAAFEPEPGGGQLLTSTPLVSAWVAEALAFLDPTSSLHVAIGMTGSVFADRVAILRTRISHFLRWQQEPSIGWRLHGRGAAGEIDLTTTAWAGCVRLRDAGPSREWFRNRLIERVRDQAPESALAEADKTRLHAVAAVADRETVERFGQGLGDHPDDPWLDHAVASAWAELPVALRDDAVARTVAQSCGARLRRRASEIELSDMVTISALLDVERSDAVPADLEGLLIDHLLAGASNRGTSFRTYPLASPALDCAWIAAVLIRLAGANR